MKKILIILIAFISCFGAPNTFAVDEDAQAQYEEYMKQINDAYEKAMQRFQNECESDTTKKWTGEECVDKTKKDIRQEKRAEKADEHEQAKQEKEKQKAADKEQRQNKQKDKKTCESDSANTWVNGECKTKKEVCTTDNTMEWMDNKCVKKDKIAKQQKKDKDKDEANQKKLCEKDGKHKYDGTRCNEKTALELCDDQKGAMINGNCITKKYCESDGEHTWNAKTKTCNDKEKSKLQQRKETKEKTESDKNEKTNKDIRKENRTKKADEREQAKQEKEKQKAADKEQRQEKRAEKTNEREQAKKQKQCEKQGGYVDNNGNCVTKEICEQDGNKTFTGSDCIEKPQETPPAPANTDDKAPEQNTPVETPKNENNVSGSATPVAQPEKEEKSTVTDTTTKIKLSAQDANITPNTLVGFANTEECFFTRGSNGLFWTSVSKNSAKKDKYYEQDYKKCDGLNMKEMYAYFPYGTLKLKAVRDNSTYDCTCTAISFKPKSSNTEESLNGESIVIPYTKADENGYTYASYCIYNCGSAIWRNFETSCKRRAKLFGLNDSNCPKDEQPKNQSMAATSTTSSSKSQVATTVTTGLAPSSPIGAGHEIDGSYYIQYDDGTIAPGNEKLYKEQGINEYNQWKLSSAQHGTVYGRAKCENEQCFCQMTYLDNAPTSTTWVKKNLFDDYSPSERIGKNCKNSCVYGCMLGIETDSDYQNRLFNSKIQKLSDANFQKYAKSCVARSHTNDCTAYRYNRKFEPIKEPNQCSALEKEQWIVDFDYGTIKGTSMCLNTKGDTKGFKKVINASTEKSGKSCWCKITQFTPSGETTQNINSYAVFLQTYDKNSACSSGCATICGKHLTASTSWRKVILNSELD